MDPPKFKFRLDFDDTLPKLKSLLLVLAINSLIVSGLIAAAYLVLDNHEISRILKTTKDTYKIYFTDPTVGNILILIKTDIIQLPVMEEFLFRYPILCLIKNNLRLRLKYDLTKYLLAINILILNTVWTWGHDLPFDNSLPIFLSGLPLYWLVIKTKCLWPSILCHAFSNFSLYLFTQTLIYFGILTKITP